VRFPEDLFQEIADVARVYDISMGEVIRKAVGEYTAKCKEDPTWNARLAQMEAAIERLRAPFPVNA
jgi:hypothetical protein